MITDVCMCEYTDHGHCGVLAPDGDVDNDATLDLLARIARLARARGRRHRRAERHDGRPRRRDPRRARPRRARDTPILAYSAKYASAFYGPFREAAGSTPAFGDRRGYQMDPANGREALRETLLDIEEGADMVMVKPALPYLDVIRAVKERTTMPLAAYNVSGEYAMLKAAVAAGYLDERAAVLEDAHLDPPRGRRHRHHLPREGRGEMAERLTARRPPLRRAVRSAALTLLSRRRQLSRARDAHRSAATRSSSRPARAPR